MSFVIDIQRTLDIERDEGTFEHTDTLSIPLRDGLRIEQAVEIFSMICVGLCVPQMDEPEQVVYVLLRMVDPHDRAGRVIARRTPSGVGDW